MKTKAAAALMAAILLTTSGCAWVGDLFDKTDYASMRQQEGEVTDEDRLRASLASYTADDILWFEYGDFDGDAVYEAFALTGTKDEEQEGAFDGVPWFVTEDYAAELATKTSWSMPELWKLGGDSYMKLEQLGAIDSISRLFGVENSKVYEPEISGRIMKLEKSGASELVAIGSAYDAMEDAEATDENGDPLGIGHTYKNYWFYYEEGVFKEYGALDTYKRADLREFPTGAAILDELLENGITKYQYDVLEQNGGLTEDQRANIAENAGYIKSIMRRGNGLWHLNYYGADSENYYITFKEENGDLTVIDEGSGHYLAALCPDIAVYPTAEEEPESSEG